jgi:hypothetical protein
VNVDEMDLASQALDVTPWRPEAYEQARTVLRAAMAESGPRPEAAPVPAVAPMRGGGFSRAGNRRRRALGAGGKVGIGAGIGAVAAAAAIALVATSAPQPAAPTGSASQAPAATSKLVTLAARISASDGSQPGNASLEIVQNTIGGKLMQVYYGLYTDSGKLYSGANKQTLMTAIAQHANGATTYDAQVVAAAREAATGNLATARMRMIDATRDVTPVQYSNIVWSNATYALNWAGGDAEIRVGVLRLLSTISAVKVVNSTTDGQPTLTIAAGPGAFGGIGDEVLIISATTGLPISSVSNPGPSAGVEDFQISRVTVANIEAGKF